MAMALLRRFGFKIHAHWMPNLLGSTPDADIADFERIFSMESIRPDELKVYPTVLIENTELESIANRGDWNAYDPDDLNEVLRFVLRNTPEYCRLTRIIRDIPSFEILAGNKKGNLRQIVEQLVPPEEKHDIRSREIKGELISPDELELEVSSFATTTTQEFFLQFVRPNDRKIAGFLRLSLPDFNKIDLMPLPELNQCAMIREVHVYGQALDFGEANDSTQHQGYGRQLIAKATQIAQEHGFKKLSVISAIGTREYYEKLGFFNDGLYQAMLL
jgi:elongator complex protein 3